MPNTSILTLPPVAEATSAAKRFIAAARGWLSAKEWPRRAVFDILRDGRRAEDRRHHQESGGEPTLKQAS